MSLIVKHIQRYAGTQPAEEAQALESSLNYGGSPGRLVQIIDAKQPGFFLAVFEAD